MYWQRDFKIYTSDSASNGRIGGYVNAKVMDCNDIMFAFYVFNFGGERERNKSALVTNTSNYAHIFMNNNKLSQPKTFLYLQ